MSHEGGEGVCNSGAILIQIGYVKLCNSMLYVHYMAQCFNELPLSKYGYFNGTREYSQVTHSFGGSCASDSIHMYIKLSYYISVRSSCSLKGPISASH